VTYLPKCFQGVAVRKRAIKAVAALIQRTLYRLLQSI